MRRNISFRGALPAGVDAYVRVLAECLTAQLEQPVAVDNRPGGTGATAALSETEAHPAGRRKFSITLPILELAHA